MMMTKKKFLGITFHLHYVDWTIGVDEQQVQCIVDMQIFVLKHLSEKEQSRPHSWLPFFHGGGVCESIVSFKSFGMKNKTRKQQKHH